MKFFNRQDRGPGEIPSTHRITVGRNFADCIPNPPGHHRLTSPCGFFITIRFPNKRWKQVFNWQEMAMIFGYHNDNIMFIFQPDKIRTLELRKVLKWYHWMELTESEQTFQTLRS